MLVEYAYIVGVDTYYNRIIQIDTHHTTRFMVRRLGE